MNNIDFGIYLKQLRKNRNLTIRQVETYAGVSNPYLSQIENGKVNIPSVEVLKKLAHIYKADYIELMTAAGYLEVNKTTNDDQPKVQDLQNQYQIPDIRRIPVYTHIPSHFPFGKENLKILKYLYLSLEQYGNGDYFAIVINDDSMDMSGICPGDVILVQSQKEVSNGDLALVSIASDNAVAKRFFQTGSLINLLANSTNRESLPLSIDPQNTPVKVFGKIIQGIIHFK